MNVGYICFSASGTAGKSTSDLAQPSQNSAKPQSRFSRNNCAVLKQYPQYFQLPSLKKYYAERYDEKSTHDIERSISVSEVAVNYGSLPVKQRTYLEFECSSKRVAIRYGMRFDADGNLISSVYGEPPNYESIPPESVADSLFQLVCSQPIPTKWQ